MRSNMTDHPVGRSELARQGISLPHTSQMNGVRIASVAVTVRGFDIGLGFFLENVSEMRLYRSLINRYRYI